MTQILGILHGSLVVWESFTGTGIRTSAGHIRTPRWRYYASSDGRAAWITRCSSFCGGSSSSGGRSYSASLLIHFFLDKQNHEQFGVLAAVCRRQPPQVRHELLHGEVVGLRPLLVDVAEQRREHGSSEYLALVLFPRNIL